MTHVDESWFDDVLADIDVDVPGELQAAVLALVHDEPTVDATEHRDQRRHRLLPIAVAAATVLGIAGLVLTNRSDTTQIGQTDPTIQSPDSTQPPGEATTTAPTTHAAPAVTPPTTLPPAAEFPRWSGGLIDDFDESSLRPLSTLAAGDVIVPTAPSGWRVIRSAAPNPDEPPNSTFDGAGVHFADPGGLEFSKFTSVTVSPEEWPYCFNECQANGSATIGGLEWESIIGDLTEPGELLRTRVGERWITVSVQLSTFDSLLDDPLVVEILQGLRVGTQDDLDEVGEARWLDFGDLRDFTGLENAPTPFGPLDPSLLRPLASMTAGDILFPTAPEDWVWLASTDSFEWWPGGFFRATPGAATVGDARFSVGSYLQVTVGPACDIGSTDPGATLCGVREAHPVIYWPLGSETEIGGVTWGYSNDDSGNIAAIVGDYAIVITDHTTGLQSPLLSDPQVVDFLEGLRVASAIDVAELFVGNPPR